MKRRLSKGASSYLEDQKRTPWQGPSNDCWFFSTSQLGVSPSASRMLKASRFIFRVFLGTWENESFFFTYIAYTTIIFPCSVVCAVWYFDYRFVNVRNGDIFCFSISSNMAQAASGLRSKLNPQQTIFNKHVDINYSRPPYNMWKLNHTTLSKVERKVETLK